MSSEEKDRSPTQEEYYRLFDLMTSSDPVPLTSLQLIMEIIDEIDEAIENGLSLKLLHLMVTTKSGWSFEYIEFRRLLRVARIRRAKLERDRWTRELRANPNNTRIK